MILATRSAFIVERSWKNMYLHPKMAWSPATYDVISCNHSNWPSLKLSQNRVLKCWRHKNESSDIMGFVRIFWKNNVQEAYLPKMSILGQIVSEMLAG